MAVVTIIGAGAMGSALAIPLIDNGCTVKLWGTNLDQDIIKDLIEGKEHPKHKHKLPSEIEFYYADELEKAMFGSTHVILAITSDALGHVFEKVVPYLNNDMIIATVSKGFDTNKLGEIVILPEILKEKLTEQLSNIPIVVVGGPCKANEVIYRSPSNVVYACEDLNAAKNFKELISTDVYNVKVDTDVIGTEVSVAMKNAYAVALGFAEGFKQREGYTHNNTKSALFTVALEEMILLSEALGGKIKSVIGLPGAGDLEVTGEAGRNRLLGEVIGGGMTSFDALAKMKDEDITVEGYSAVNFGYRLSINLIEKGLLTKELPLLSALYKILYNNESCYASIKKVLNEYN
ncbi:glycerol-3-phosphate dehydrogenase [Alkalibaculum sp. M08DMB]|uniref:Glycerol-3-phosphate dehydrogenase n=1 Tax=Alkalibaculum sporogenes TaxID=2655001 RepID=A0A6A7KD70_9FIRM|nr:2-dehydropantoate 2-reductase N-terminal domain-containing protein [Alkalibaculum sporogenes]MPW27281.1 glycerol-3-phosphate dehydrogenase [Alkalibaculum sporogenes]